MSHHFTDTARGENNRQDRTRDHAASTLSSFLGINGGRNIQLAEAVYF
jgi:hypothetical protein